jgi:hypothetical protein
MKRKILGRASFALIVAGLLATALPADAADAGTNGAGSTGEKAAPDRFYGSVSKVDTNKNTFTVGEQMFVVTAETQITKKDGEKGSLADAVVGEPARGTYTKKSDGTLNVTKVRFGKKANSKAGGSGKSGGKKKSEPSGGAESKQP